MLASNVADSFAKYRWAPNIIGPQSGGAVKDLPVHLYEAMGQIQAKIPTEVLITDRREFELAEEGFITLTMRKNSDNAAFFSANSVQKPKHFLVKMRKPTTSWERSYPICSLSAVSPTTSKYCSVNSLVRGKKEAIWSVN